MDRIEELVRDSLQTRARDVEPTPALWREVERRIERRRRHRVLTWSLAGAAAAAAALLVMPAMVGLVTTPDVPEIAPLEEAPAPAGATVPAHAVVVGTDGQTGLLDLRTRDVTDLGGFLGRAGDTAVSAPSTPAELSFAIALERDGNEHQYLISEAGRGGSSQGTAATFTSTFPLTEHSFI